ncbi:zwei Ig domain protein zig-8-like isoform X2 [Eupeodes corollae]|uniref:zwei Ig domain protein zig-8-like isoform X2 n=1 Tax=Eupeodes corollae TaxID=290404 RepID=UPI00249389EC|nr:zwei Ig domain protein zig-8-like isoform X2 [Eupeodes corollae]
MPTSRIYLTLLTAVILGTDPTISEAEFFETFTTIVSSSSSGGSSSSSSSSSISISSNTELSSNLPSTIATQTRIAAAGTTTTTIPPLSQILAPEALHMNQDELYLESSYANNPPKNFTVQETNVTVQIGSHAYLPCHIRRLLNKPVSWVRVRDDHILTVDQTTFIADQRFQSIFKGEHEFTWSLQIKYVGENDMGWYECQVSTEPKMSARVYLKVVVPRTELIGDHNRFVKAGSKVALHCIVRGSLEPPSYIIWFQGTKQIMNDNKQGWFMQIDRNIFGNHTDQQNTIGSLIIPYVKKKDSGNYTCSPSNSAPVTVDLHVLSGEYSASAIMSSAVINRHNFYYLLIILIVLACQKT